MISPIEEEAHREERKDPRSLEHTQLMTSHQMTLVTSIFRWGTEVDNGKGRKLCFHGHASLCTSDCIFSLKEAPKSSKSHISLKSRSA